MVPRENSASAYLRMRIENDRRNVVALHLKRLLHCWGKIVL
jgi:hypothetical protein